MVFVWLEEEWWKQQNTRKAPCLSIGRPTTSPRGACPQARCHPRGGELPLVLPESRTYNCRLVIYEKYLGIPHSGHLLDEGLADERSDHLRAKADCSDGAKRHENGLQVIQSDAAVDPANPQTEHALFYGLEEFVLG